MNIVKLKIIGCGDAFGSGGRLNTCFYVDAGLTKLLMDCGASSLPGLKHHGIHVADIDAIVISHFHGDHYGGVPFLLLDAAIHGRKKKLSIISPPGGKQKVSALLELLYPGTPVLEKLELDFLEYNSNEVLETENFSVQAFPVIHSEEALPHGLRLTISGAVISYSGDTSWTDVLLPLSDQADLFICECNFFGTKVKGHLSYVELEKKLTGFTCKRLLLTHFDQEMLDRLGEVQVGWCRDGMEVMI